MIPYVLPIGLFVVLAAGRVFRPLANAYRMSDAAAWSLAAMLLMTGVSHFVGLREDLIRMVPPYIPRADLVVTLTGILELLGAVGLVYRPSRKAAGIALAVLFLAMLPANIYAAQQGLTLRGEPVTPLVIRIPEQLIFIGLALGAAFAPPRKRPPESPL